MSTESQGLARTFALPDRGLVFRTSRRFAPGQGTRPTNSCRPRALTRRVFCRRLYLGRIGTSAGDGGAGRQPGGCHLDLPWRRLLCGPEEQLRFLGGAVELEDHRGVADFQAPNDEVAVAHPDLRLFIFLQGAVI